jgi:hypothetical protein
MLNPSGCRPLWAASFFFAALQCGSGSVQAARDPAISLITGRTATTPIGPAGMDFGWRGGIAFEAALHAGELRLPLEIGVSGRTAVLWYDGLFERDRFTDIQMPFLFHVPVGGKRLEILGLWIPSYTLEMSQISSSSGTISDTKSLRTRFNMGLGTGLQVVLPWGIRLRGHWVYNLFSPYPAAKMTWGEFEGGLALPLLFRKREE